MDNFNSSPYVKRFFITLLLFALFYLLYYTSTHGRVVINTDSSSVITATATPSTNEPYETKVSQTIKAGRAKILKSGKYSINVSSNNRKQFEIITVKNFFGKTEKTYSNTLGFFPKKIASDVNDITVVNNSTIFSLTANKMTNGYFRHIENSSYPFYASEEIKTTQTFLPISRFNDGFLVLTTRSNDISGKLSLASLNPVSKKITFLSQVISGIEPNKLHTYSSSSGAKGIIIYIEGQETALFFEEPNSKPKKILVSKKADYETLLFDFNDDNFVAIKGVYYDEGVINEGYAESLGYNKEKTQLAAVYKRSNWSVSIIDKKRDIEHRFQVENNNPIDKIWLDNQSSTILISNGASLYTIDMVSKKSTLIMSESIESSITGRWSNNKTDFIYTNGHQIQIINKNRKSAVLFSAKSLIPNSILSDMDGLVCFSASEVMRTLGGNRSVGLYCITNRPVQDTDDIKLIDSTPIDTSEFTTSWRNTDLVVGVSPVYFGQSQPKNTESSFILQKGVNYLRHNGSRNKRIDLATP